MAYPVNKFHPDRHAPAVGPPEDQIRKGLKRELKGLDVPSGSGDHDQAPRQRELLEEIPRPQMRSRAKPTVHFDIDPQNSKSQGAGPALVRLETDKHGLQS